MVFQAIDAAVLTSNTMDANDSADVQLEVTLAENKIRGGCRGWSVTSSVQCNHDW
jgi:hypothetical protein